MTVEDALAKARWFRDQPGVAIDTAGAKSWPIVSATFILLPTDPKDPARAANVMKFFDWAYKQGDKTAADLDYVPMHDAVKNVIFKQNPSDDELAKLYSRSTAVLFSAINEDFGIVATVQYHGSFVA